MNKVSWLYCGGCGWQTEEPDSACEPTCPDCRKGLRIARFSAEEFAADEALIRASVKEFVERGPR